MHSAVRLKDGREVKVSKAMGLISDGKGVEIDISAIAEVQQGGKWIKVNHGEDIIQLEGYKEPIRLDDKILATLDDETGKEMTVRELLERLDEDAEVLKAVSTCSVGVTSATA
jgi:hypothetical protein